MSELISMLNEDSFIILGSSPLNSFHNRNDLLDADEVESVLGSMCESQVENLTASADTCNGSEIQQTDQRDKEGHVSMANTSACNDRTNQTNTIQLSIDRSTCRQNSQRNSPHSRQDSATEKSVPPNGDHNVTTSIHSQLPSLCSTEDSLDNSVKMENLLMEYHGLKDDLVTANLTLKQFYERSQHWEAEKRDLEYKNATLSRENLKLKEDLLKATKTIAETNIETEIKKVEQRIIENTQKQYVDQITNLKAKLSAAEETIQEHRSNIAQETCSQHTRECVGLKEELAVLREQVEVYSKDFQEERNARLKLLSEINHLHLKNLALMEKVKQSGDSIDSIDVAAPPSNGSLSASAFEANIHQRPIRVMPGTSANLAASLVTCPVCYKRMPSLGALESHVNRCLDNTT